MSHCLMHLAPVLQGFSTMTENFLAELFKISPEASPRSRWPLGRPGVDEERRGVLHCLHQLQRQE